MTAAPAALVRDRRGVAALEFGFVASALVVLCLGTFEISQVYLAATKLKGAAEGVAELVALEDTVSTATLDEVCTAGRMMVLPFPADTLGLEVASVMAAGGGAAATQWHSDRCAGNGTTDPAAVVAGMGLLAGENVVVVRASYVYRSPLLFFLPDPITLHGDAIARPRKDVVEWSAS